jgi:small subunit ribosomal protein S4
MIIGPKYKIARRLQSPIFEKTQTAKFKERSARRAEKSNKRMGGAKNQFGAQLIEKQKVRLTYRLSEKQFSNYVKKAVEQKKVVANVSLLQHLESRLDNILFRSGISESRGNARQMSSHGHIMVNGTRVTIPSMAIGMNDIISIRSGSKTKKLFEGLEARLMEKAAPVWLSIDPKKLEVKVIGAPESIEDAGMLDFQSVIEFYSR